MLARIAGDQPLDAHQDTRTTRLILQRGNPLGIRVGLLNSHAASVAQRLQVSMSERLAMHNAPA